MDDIDSASVSVSGSCDNDYVFLQHYWEKHRQSRAITINPRPITKQMNIAAM